DIVKAAAASMQLMFPIILWQLVINPIKRESRSCYPSGHPSDNSSEKRRMMDILFKCVKPKNYILYLSFTIRDRNIGDDSPVFDTRYTHSMIIAESIGFNTLSIQAPKDTFRYVHVSLPQVRLLFPKSG